MLGMKRLLTGLVLATLALSTGCKSNKDSFSAVSSADDKKDQDGVDVITSVEHSAPNNVSKSERAMPDIFEGIRKDDFLTQVSDSERSVYGLDKDNLYDYYRLVVSDRGMRCTQYLAMGKRVWSKLRRKKVEIEKHNLGYGFKVFQLSDKQQVSQTAPVIMTIRIDFYCSSDGKSEAKHHRVLIAYESSQGMNAHTKGDDLVTDMKVPLVYPRFEALRGDSKNGELRLRDIVFVDTNAYYQDQDKDVSALAVATAP